MKLMRTILFSVLAAATCCQAAALRETLLLDGTWQIAEGAMAHQPDKYAHSAPVPGLVDLARPAFEEPGIKSDKREAFWYRRTFTIAGPIPAVARLKLHKAMFGCKVLVNGAVLGEQKVAFTPVVFDLKKVLRVGENEILVRVGAWLPDAKTSIGWDQEKSRFIPGIFDSVEVILSGAATIERVQAVPDVEKQSVTIHSWPAQPTHFVVREARSQKVAGEADGTDEVAIAIPGCRLWSPEDPFLYEVVAKTAGDELSARFGMRSFRLDPQTGRAVLNGKPYFMRGSNITLYRFFEDAQRGSLPWSEAWVRKLHRRCKEMHWNALRYCIGFPPEFWYRIADEEGLLIQDEFPIWLPFAKAGTLHVEELAGYYRDWMQERWNHPSVVIWDACNETKTPDTGAALAKVRDLDFSNRPWDDGWSAPSRPTDSRELHPYHYVHPDTTLEILRYDDGLLGRRPGYPAIINNEYGWLWINRDGSATHLTKNLYSALLGPIATPEARRRCHARYLAAETEYWRAKRSCAAVMHFCALGYSRPNGATSDNWMDVEKLEFDPLFATYVRDAFAPVGVMVDDFMPEHQAGLEVNFPLVVFSDLAAPWKGQLRFDLSCGGKTVTEKRMKVELEAWGKTQLACPVQMPNEIGDYQVKATLLDTPTGPVSSRRDFSIKTRAQQLARDGIAVGKPARSSSSDSRNYWPKLAAAAANDASLQTAWLPMTNSHQPQWLAIDLEQPTTISRVELVWKRKFPKQYVIQVSPDGQTWTDVCKQDAGKGGAETLSFAPVNTRWVRFCVQQDISKTGCALAELRVFAANPHD